MNKVSIKFLAQEGAIIPEYKTSGAAGADVCAADVCQQLRRPGRSGVCGCQRPEDAHPRRSCQDGALQRISGAPPCQPGAQLHPPLRHRRHHAGHLRHLPCSVLYRL